MRATGFEPATVGFGVQRSTVGATPSWVTLLLPAGHSSLRFLIKHPLYAYYFTLVEGHL